MLLHLKEPLLLTNRQNYLNVTQIKLYICFDGDTAGIKATFKALEILLTNNIEVKIIELPEGSDPDSIFSQNGKECLAKHINSS